MCVLNQVMPQCVFVSAHYRSVLKSSEKLTLSADETKVVYPLPEPEEKYSLLEYDLDDSQEETPSDDTGDGQSYKKTDETIPEECWD